MSVVILTVSGLTCLIAHISFSKVLMKSLELYRKLVSSMTFPCLSYAFTNMCISFIAYKALYLLYSLIPQTNDNSVLYKQELCLTHNRVTDNIEK